MIKSLKRIYHSHSPKREKKTKQKHMKVDNLPRPKLGSWNQLSSYGEPSLSFHFRVREYPMKVAQDTLDSPLSKVTLLIHI